MRNRKDIKKKLVLPFCLLSMFSLTSCFDIQHNESKSIEKSISSFVKQEAISLESYIKINCDSGNEISGYSINFDLENIKLSYFPSSKEYNFLIKKNLTDYIVSLNLVVPISGEVEVIETITSLDSNNIYIQATFNSSFENVYDVSGLNINENNERLKENLVYLNELISFIKNFVESNNIDFDVERLPTYSPILNR